ncbi:hypothetical protein L1887_02869 [Cichorium endivia]|nr:hypothetical protein L1887_02869 [Cichorium endivia]
MAELESITTVLPPDITLYHILPRLPGKSVARFTRVSKQWHSFIRTHGFHKMHLHHVINNDHQNHQKLLFLPHKRPWDFQTIDCETPEDGITVSRPVSFKVRPGQEISIVASLHGMVCAVVLRRRGSCFGNEYSDLILWNPMTGDYKTLSKAGLDCHQIYGNQFGLYYSSSEDDYKLVCLTRHLSSVYIYSLKSDSWIKVETPGWTSDHFSYYVAPSVLLNEKFYFVNRLSSSQKSYSIVMFDTQTEKLKDIETPHFGNRWTNCMGFVVVKDCIHFCVGFINSIHQYDTIEQWRMDGNGDWTKVETSSFEEQLRYWSHMPEHLMRNGNWLMYSSSGEHVYVLNAKKHTKNISLDDSSTLDFLLHHQLKKLLHKGGESRFCF